jgi:hypothetical protein
MPLPEAIADAMKLVAMIGELRRLAEVSRREADHYEGVHRQRLLSFAECTLQNARLIEALATEEETYEEG